MPLAKIEKAIVFDPGLDYNARNAVGVVLLLNVCLPLLWMPYRAAIYQSSPIAFWSLREVLLLLLPLTSLLVLARYYRISTQSYGLPLRPKLDLDFFGTGFIVAVMMLIAYWVPSKVAWVYLRQIADAQSFMYQRDLPHGFLGAFLNSYTSVEAAIFESIIFVGLPWLLFRNRCHGATGRFLFSMLSAAVFGACHAANALPEVIAIFFLGLTSALFYLKLGQLWPSIIGHAVVDISTFIQ